MRHNALKQVANRIRDVFALNILICVFMGVIPFDLVFGSRFLLFAIPFPETRDEVPEKFVKN
jgi:hypothetical protein